MLDKVPLASAPHVVGVIALVTVEHVSRRQALQELLGCFAISHLAAGQHNRHAAAEAISQGVDLGRSPAVRAPNRLLALPPLAPEAERCAFTAEMSMSTCALGRGAEPLWSAQDAIATSAGRRSACGSICSMRLRVQAARLHSALQDVDNAADHPAVIDPRLASRVGG